MRKYTRKPIKLTDVSAIAIRKPMKARDEIEQEAERLRKSGWADRPKRDAVPELDGAFTYTTFATPRKPVDKSHDVIVVKRKREHGEKTERQGRIFTDKRGFAD